MKHFIDVEVPSKMSRKLEKITCDICGDTLSNDLRPEIDEITIASRKGYSFPEGGCVDYIEYDICRKCFERYIVKPLTALGAKPREYDSDF